MTLLRRGLLLVAGAVTAFFAAMFAWALYEDWRGKNWWPRY